MIYWDAYPLAEVVAELLIDRTTNKNILFATDERRDQITEKFLSDIKPRDQKSDDEKFSRTRRLAEVFTPPEVVSKMIDYLHDENLNSRWLEISCGEAPFLVEVLKRKLRRVENFSDALDVLKNIYGYELQGDSLLIARAKILQTFVDFAEKSFGKLYITELHEVAEIISWNIWQMDGSTDAPPFSEKFSLQANLFTSSGCVIVDWRADKDIFFGQLKGGKTMKFDFVISNPPYQDDTDGKNKTFAPPLYNLLMEGAYKIGNVVEFITPARFLFDAGATPKDFNRRMLSDPHLKVLQYEPDASKVFRNVDIEGGVVITLRDATKNFGAIGVFTPFEELNSIHKKVCVDDKTFQPLSKIMYSRTAYSLTKKAHEDFPDAKQRFSAGNQYQMSSNVFGLMPEIFFDAKPEDGHEYIQLYGRQNNERVFKFVRRDYVTAHESLNKFKVFVADAFGRSNLGDEAGQLISQPAIGEPNQGCTQTFITVGAFDTRDEAEACFKYVKSKFARVMLGILKVTKHNPPSTWAKVPLQNFSSTSDIDWHGDVDGQLYRKYNLNAAEINFIETHVKAMD